MKEESKGVIIGIEAVLVALCIVGSSILTKGIQNSYVSVGDGDGSQACFFAYACILGAYFVIVLIYTVIDLYKEKKNNAV